MNSPISRRRFLSNSGALAGIGIAAGGLRSPYFDPGAEIEAARQSPDQIPTGYILHIKSSPIEIAPKRIISATTYNGQFPGPLLRSKRDDKSRWIFTTTPTRRSNCIGMVKKFQLMWTEPPRRARPSFLRMANGDLPSLQIRLAFASTTLTTGPEQISLWANMVARSGRYTSSPLRNQAGMTAKCFSSLRSSSPLSVAAVTCLKISYLRQKQIRS
jgi:hypothetical protein